MPKRLYVSFITLVRVSELSLENLELRIAERSALRLNLDICETQI